MTNLFLGTLEAIGDARAGRKRAASGDAAPAIVITGATGGIGCALAETFTRASAFQDHALVLVGRSEPRLAEAARRVALAGKPKRASAAEGEHNRVLVLSLDLTRDDAADELIGFCQSNGLQPDILINCAGHGFGGEALDQPLADVVAQIDLNVAALVRLTHRMLPDMLARGRGGVINVSSLGGFLPGPFQAHYYASKAYVTSFTLALAQEVSGRGVRVTTVAPGPVDTRFHARMGKGTESAYYRVLLPSLSPEQVARSVLRGYLAGNRLIVPGLIMRVMAATSGVLPHFVAVRLMALLLRPR